MSASREKNKRKEQTAEQTPASASKNGKKGMSKGMKTFVTVVCVVLVVAIVTFFTMLTGGFFATHSTAAAVGTHQLSPVMVNYFYRDAYFQMQKQWGDLFSMLVDTSKSLTEQYYDEEQGITWADQLIEQGLNNAAQTYAEYDAATAEGYTLSQERLDAVEAQISLLDTYASAYGYASADAFLAAQYGTGASVKSYREYQMLTATVTAYLSDKYDEGSYTEEELDAAYQENVNNYDTVTYRLFTVSDSLFDTEDETELATLRSETAAAMAEASQAGEQAFLDQALENTPEDSREGYDAESATLRSDASYSGATAALQDWLFDQSRQAGDVIAVDTDSTSYVAFFLSRNTHDFPMVNVRHILISASDSSDETAIDEARAKAEELLAQFESGDKTEDSFAELAKENSADSNASEGGLYENVYPGYMETAFNDWCFDESRQVGDTGIVQTSYGFHVMYFSGYGDNYRDYLVETNLRNTAVAQWQASVTEGASYTTQSFGMRFVTK